MTGPEALSLTDMARIIGEAQGREVTYREETVKEAYASRAHYGAPAWELDPPTPRSPPGSWTWSPTTSGP